MVDYADILESIRQEVQPLLTQGKVADYIPPLAEVDPSQFAMAVRLVDGSEYSAGAADHAFSIQSVSKVFRLAQAMDIHGDDLWKRVGREASGTAFNSLLQLEADNGKPRNPMISSGALVVMDAILERGLADPGIVFIARCLDDEAVPFDAGVADAELATTHRNRALAHLLKAYGNLNNDPEAVIAAHTRESAVTLSCVELCRAATFLATRGETAGGQRVLATRQVKRLNAVMLTCGVYDEAGDYAYRVGLPAKSGVGGGVIAVMPGLLTVAVWSPGLNPRGNSLAGTKALELFTTMTGVSVF
ncbi:MAG: glutaminase [Rhodothermales bacterium]|nr:glutaminase [Rhodothermales bacterium]